MTSAPRSTCNDWVLVCSVWPQPCTEHALLLWMELHQLEHAMPWVSWMFCPDPALTVMSTDPTSHMFYLTSAPHRACSDTGTDRHCLERAWEDPGFICDVQRLVPALTSGCNDPGAPCAGSGLSSAQEHAMVLSSDPEYGTVMYRLEHTVTPGTCCGLSNSTADQHLCVQSHRHLGIRPPSGHSTPSSQMTPRPSHTAPAECGRALGQFACSSSWGFLF